MNGGKALAVVVVVLAAVSAAAQAPSLAITGVTVIDVIDGRTLTNRTVAISGGTITSITDGDAPPAGAHVVNGQGKVLHGRRASGHEHRLRDLAE